MDSKSFLTSVTLWGAVMSLINPYITPYLIQIGINADAAWWSAAAVKAAGIAAFVLTIYGRWRKGDLHLSPPRRPS